ncbi:hypothetical protein B296_00048260 [Ensete ventricosum]|uniref:STAS domain-containing protein n=1 Tax=Ensete ventricosum TaxID=4639 RepID=A0A426Y9R9_ENSVE|nr:hypothetical protein B296_00048260 [Ensete ventricosum]
MMVHSVSDEVESKDIEMASRSSSHRQTENYKSVHKVGLPPRRNFIGEFSETLKETFFADDPLRPYKDQPRSRQLVLGLQFLFPVLEWGRSYNLSKFKGDVIAGLTIASLCIPQKSRKFFWVPAIAPLISVILSTFFVYITRADKHAVTDIDTSGIHAFEELYRSLKKREIQLFLANPGPVVIQKLHLAKFTELIGHEKIFLSVAEAVMSCTPKAREDS